MQTSQKYNLIFFVKFKIFGFILRKAEKFRKFLVYVLDVIP